MVAESQEAPSTGESVTIALPITLALDAEGGDRGPAEVVAGALDAASPELHILLVGRPEVVAPHLGQGHPSVSVVASSTVISSSEEPARAVRSREDSSIVVGARLVAQGRARAFVSAGSTGAMLAAGLLFVKRTKGIKRPAILTVLPGIKGPVVFLDAGANADCRPEHLLEFAILGTAFARRGLGLVRPSVGLLNIGEEEGKGNELAVQAHRLLSASGLEFKGNIEGRDLLFNVVDVVVTDGFTGNVALKLLEGTARALFLQVRGAAARDLRSKAGGFLLKPSLLELRSRLDPETYGGTYLLGLRGLLVICHGNSSRRAITNALLFGAEAVRRGLTEEVGAEAARYLSRQASGEPR